MTPIHLTAANTIAELLATHPGAARVLVDRRMHCVGCDIAPFETIGDACALYGVAVEDFFAEINRALAAGGTTDGDNISNSRWPACSIVRPGEFESVAAKDPRGIHRDAGVEVDAATGGSVVELDRVTGRRRVD